MTDAALSLRRADGDAIEYVEALLSACDLPARDVHAKPGCFYVARVEGERVGVGGLEIYDAVGLLRSVAVEPEARGRGVGAALCDRLEATARERDVDALYLLTTTAEGFFAGRGYEAVERSEAPAAIRDTTEFAELCPSTATCMRTSL